MAEGALSICMVTTFYPPLHFGGDATYAYQLTNALARRGHAVTVVHSADAYRALGGTAAAGDFAHVEGVTVRPVATGMPRAAALGSYLLGRPAFWGGQLREVLDGRRYDVVHFHNVSLLGGPGVLRLGDAVKLYTTSEHWLVCPMHVLFRYNREPCEEPRCLRCTLAFRRPPQVWRYGRLLEDAARQVDLFLSPSRFTLEAHRARGFTFPMRHLPYFFSGHVRAAAPAARTLPRPYFLYVGRLEPIKGVAELIEVFRGYTSARLLIAGEGTQDAELRRRAEGLEHVRFLGRLHPSQLAALYEGATALIVPSIGYEVFGIVALEAFACRTPVLVRALGALPEVVEDSGGGLVFETDDQLRSSLDRLLADEALRSDLGTRGHDAWQRLWSEEVHIEQYLECVAAARELRRCRS